MLSKSVASVEEYREDLNNKVKKLAGLVDLEEKGFFPTLNNLIAAEIFSKEDAERIVSLYNASAKVVKLGLVDEESKKILNMSGKAVIQDFERRIKKLEQTKQETGLDKLRRLRESSSK